MKSGNSGNGFSDPFPHTIIDNFLDPEIVRRINQEWPKNGAWHVEDGKGQKKRSTQRLPPMARIVADRITPSMVESIMGIDGLIADPSMFGAGLHDIDKGGFLKMHTDFNAHPNGWRRAVNVLVYLNEIWLPEWNGQLILSRDGRSRDASIDPVGGRVVMFETTQNTWHGHPDPLDPPPGVTRRSLALYFYVDQHVDNKTTTVYAA